MAIIPGTTRFKHKRKCRTSGSYSDYDNGMDLSGGYGWDGANQSASQNQCCYIPDRTFSVHRELATPPLTCFLPRQCRKCFPCVRLWQSTMQMTTI